MDTSFFAIENLYMYLVMGILLFFGAIEAISGLYHDSQRRKDDWWLEIVSFVALSALIKPGIALAVVGIGSAFFAEYQNAYVGMSLWIGLPLYLIIDDILQYWYHRFAHEYEWLWKLHRPHHAATEMGFLISYRNAALYYVLMPNIWWIGIFIFVGGAKAAAIGIVLKQLVIIGSHSPTKWDQFLYKYKALHPLAWVLERIFITPAAHFAHHGKSRLDGISDPNGNFGNMLFIWDQLFGTALITRQYPTELGLMNDPEDSWTSHFLYPLIKSDKPDSEISSGYTKEKDESLKPIQIELEPGKYLWCKCGFSRNQPFCDGSHHGTKYKPKIFMIHEKQKVSLCTCKATKNSPFCDFTHVEIAKSKRK